MLHNKYITYLYTLIYTYLMKESMRTFHFEYTFGKRHDLENSFNPESTPYSFISPFSMELSSFNISLSSFHNLADILELGNGNLESLLKYILKSIRSLMILKVRSSCGTLLTNSKDSSLLKSRLIFNWDLYVS